MHGQAQQLERLASDLYALAADISIPSRTVQRSERLIAEGERIAHGVRVVVRGRADYSTKQR